MSDCLGGQTNADLGKEEIPEEGRATRVERGRRSLNLLSTKNKVMKYTNRQMIVTKLYSFYALRTKNSYTLVL
jgi:hypothetical protein